MKNKGFTLVELLAVLLILGALMLLVGISITKIMKDNKKKTFKASISKYVEIATQYQMDNDVLVDFNCEINKGVMECYTLNGDVKNNVNKPYTKEGDISGKLSFHKDNNDVDACVYNDSLLMNGTTDSEITSLEETNPCE